MTLPSLSTLESPTSSGYVSIFLVERQLQTLALCLVTSGSQGSFVCFSLCTGPAVAVQSPPEEPCTALLGPESLRHQRALPACLLPQAAAAAGLAWSAGRQMGRAQPRWGGGAPEHTAPDWRADIEHLSCDKARPDFSSCHLHKGVRGHFHKPEQEGNRLPSNRKVCLTWLKSG